MVDVNYDAETNTFVNASPMKMDSDKKECSGKEAKACCSSKKGTSASATSKGCCSKKGSSKSASTTTTTKTEAETKPTKG